MRKLILLAATAALPLAALTAFHPAQAAGTQDAIALHGKAGAYALTLRVLPAESFAGPHNAMTWDGGAKPNLLKAKPTPNRHLVVFIKKGGKPVEQAKVTLRYREGKGAWMPLPVARMHVTGTNLSTTHFGNNVRLGPGRYTVQVSVNGTSAPPFHFTLKR